MKDSKGQALVEFILIMPVLVFILLAMIDIGNIVVQKYELENELDTVIELYQNNDKTLENYITEKNINLTYERDYNYTTIILENKVNVKTPGLNNIIGKNYLIKAKRTIYNE